MEKLDNQIEKKERELQQLKSYRQTAKIEEIATIDQNIISAELQIKRLKESQLLQEIKRKKTIPNDKLLQAKAHMREMMDQISNEGIPNDGNDPRLIASERLLHFTEQLDLLRMASQETELPVSDNSIFTEQFKAYISAKTEKLNTAREQIAKKDKEIEKTEQLLETAIKEGNAEKIIEYSDSLETAKKTRAYLEPMVKEIENSETFAPGTISNAWKGICDMYKHEWNMRIEIINRSLEIHQRACQELITFANLLNSLRYEIQRIGTENGSQDQIVKYNAQMSDMSDLDQVRNVKRDQYESLYRYIYFDRSKLL